MIIGLTGKSGAGKDTVAKILCDEFGFTRIAFADKIKAAAREIFGFSQEQLHGAEKDKTDPFWGCRPSTVLQLLGVECIRNGFAGTVIGRDVWIKAAMRDMETSKSYVFTDVRFTNEAKRLTDIEGKILRITRHAHVSERAAHVSETAMDGYHCDEIVNDGSLNDLRPKLHSWMAR